MQGRNGHYTVPPLSFGEYSDFICYFVTQYGRARKYRTLLHFCSAKPQR